VRERIVDFDDPRLDEYRNIPDQQLLVERGLFMAEGRLVVSRLLASSRFPVRSLMVTRVACDALGDALAGHPDVPVYEVAQDTMNHVAGLNIHRGCLAIGERTGEITPDALARSARTLVALEGVGNADNVGGIFRNAAALGADGVLLDRASADPLYRKALRTSMGAALQVPFARADNWLDTLRIHRQAGMRLVALTPDSAADALADVAASLVGERIVLVLGHEGDGLSDATLAECDVRARIPMQPGVDSLNVSSATAIALYEVGSRR
jgi:tRNA G18 (ribose-2'-O)-methylase SpoU